MKVFFMSNLSDSGNVKLLSKTAVNRLAKLNLKKINLFVSSRPTNWWSLMLCVDDHECLSISFTRSTKNINCDAT